MADDAVNPKHYASLGKYAAIYVITAWKKGFEIGNALKYIQRAGSKPGESEARDYEKAIWYIRRHLHLLDPEKYPDPAEEYRENETDKSTMPPNDPSHRGIPGKRKRIL